MIPYEHIPVLADECVTYLDIKQGGVYIDGTVGGAGHSLMILGKLAGDGAALLGIDCDETAAAVSAGRLESKNAELGNRVRCVVVKSNFRHIDNICKECGINGADGILLDLGVSSHQLDDSGRGFSYQWNSRLDMRMDLALPVDAADIVNGYSERELADIIYKYGEERWAGRISRFIADRRARRPICTTGELADTVLAAIPKGARNDARKGARKDSRKDGPHPAQRTFQALRIAVNGELDALADVLVKCADLLKPGGRLCVISFHSLEDRIVKNAIREMSSDCICPKDLPVCVCGHKAIMKPITRKPILPSESEVARNPRAGSAKLRVAERL